MNLVEEYIYFIKKNLVELANLIISNNDKEYEKLIDIYTNLFVKNRYYHELETLDKSEVTEYNFETIIKEFNGKRIELLFEYKKNDEKEYYNLTELAYQAVATAILLNNFTDSLITEDNVKEIIKTSIVNISEMPNNSKICKLILLSREKERMFLKTIFSNDFYLRYIPYRYKNTFFHVELYQNIKELDEYSKKVVRKNLNKEIFSSKVLEATLNLLNLDLISSLKSNNELTHYFIKLPSDLLDQKEECLRLFHMVDTPYIRNKIVFLIDFKEYMKHKRVINIVDEKFLFAALVDMSHINEIDNKLANVESINAFQFVVCDKVKDKDYKDVLTYQTLTGKEIFINELEKE